MNESDARQVLLVRAVETAPAAEGAAAHWRDEDAAWAAAEARRQVGEHATPESFLAARAALVLQRLGERDAAWRRDAMRPARGTVVAVLLLGGLLLAAAIAGNVLGSERRINLLAPPILALLLWNLAVYGVLAAGALRRRGRAKEGAVVAPPPGSVWAGLVRRLATLLAAHSGAAPVAAVRARHVGTWALASAPLQSQRITAVMHSAAALLALAVVLSMYVFGLAFDFRAGWDSTWLDAPQVQRVLQVVFGPAAALGGIELPDAEALAALRWADGSSGERAARWIHLYALTLAGVVIVPRVLLAALALRRAQRAAQQMHLPLDEPYFRRLLRESPAQAKPVAVLSYSYRLDNEAQAALEPALADALDPGALPHWVANLPLGAEDDLARLLPADLGDNVALLFPATATPERETHGAFVQAIGALQPPVSFVVLVDESGLRDQFGAGVDWLQRRSQRREAWQRMLQALSLPAPHFVDLGERIAA